MNSSRRQMEPVRAAAEFGEQHAATLAGEQGLVEEEPDDGRRLTWQEHLAIGDQAYAEAVEREDTHGLDQSTVDKYRTASRHLLSVTATGPTINREPEPADPLRLMKIAGSLAKQAQATDPEDVYVHAGQRINVKNNKQRIAAETLQRAGRMMMGDEHHRNYQAMVEEFDGEDPAEVVVEAAVEAARETGTADYVSGPHSVDEDTTERLEAQGTEALDQFIKEHALESGPQGLEFVARTAELAIETAEEITGEHTLPALARH